MRNWLFWRFRFFKILKYTRDIISNALGVPHPFKLKRLAARQVDTHKSIGEDDAQERILVNRDLLYFIERGFIAGRIQQTTPGKDALIGDDIDVHPPEFKYLVRAIHSRGKDSNATNQVEEREDRAYLGIGRIEPDQQAKNRESQE